MIYFDVQVEAIHPVGCDLRYGRTFRTDKDPWSARRVKSDLNQAIWWAFQAAGITIAYPQLDVHFDRPVVEVLHGGGIGPARRIRPETAQEN